MNHTLHVMTNFKRIYCTIVKERLQVIVEDCTEWGAPIRRRRYDNITWATKWRIRILAGRLKVYPSFYDTFIEVVIVGSRK